MGGRWLTTFCWVLAVSRCLAGFFSCGLFELLLTGLVFSELTPLFFGVLVGCSSLLSSIVLSFSVVVIFTLLTLGSTDLDLDVLLSVEVWAGSGFFVWFVWPIFTFHLVNWKTSIRSCRWWYSLLLQKKVASWTCGFQRAKYGLFCVSIE